MSTTKTFDEYATWINPSPGDEPQDIAREAYQTAVKQLQVELSHIRKAPVPIGTSATIQDIQDAIGEAKQQYESKPKSHQKAREWLEKLSCRVMHYSRAFDTIASHHQEYVALAWGAIKLVLTGIINRAVLMQKLSEALVAIADVLPRADLNAALYPTKLMEAALSRLYAHIILFSIQCVRWYKRSSGGRLWSALKDPFELQYHDLVEHIKLCSENIDAIANAGLRVESRHGHGLLKRHDSRLTEVDARLIEMQKSMTNCEDYMRHLMHIGTSSQTTIERMSIHVCATDKRTQRIEFRKVVEFFAPKILPDTALLKIRSFARRNPAWNLPSSNISKIQRTLGDWAWAKHSQILIVRVGLRGQQQAKSFASDVINFISSSAQPLFWSLSVTNASERIESIADVLKSIIFQLLQRMASLFNEFEEQLNLLKIQSPHTEQEWADLISLLLSKVPKAFIILETHGLSQLYRHESEWANRFLNLLQTIIDRTTALGSRLKILLVMHVGVTKLQPDSPKDCNRVAISLQPSNPVPPHLRHVARRGELHMRG